MYLIQKFNNWLKLNQQTKVRYILRAKLRLAYFVVSIFLYGCGYTGTIKTDDESLRAVIRDFEKTIINLQSIKNLNKDNMPKKIDNGYNYSVTLFENDIEKGFEIKVFDIRRFESIGSALECITYFSYSSNGKYIESRVKKKLEDWALIRECRA